MLVSCYSDALLVHRPNLIQRANLSVSHCLLNTKINPVEIAAGNGGG
jgi:hypothetical protein